jgi:hypothetical protein
MSTGAQYVVAAYGVVLFALLMYVVVIGLKSARMAREAELLALLVERQGDEEDPLPARQDDPVGAPAPPRPR